MPFIDRKRTFTIFRNQGVAATDRAIHCLQVV
ncbi:Uncharacterised protein [Vibrio cholerae]|nr:Uncharacterised protein [Vibrio cholerae]